MYKFGRDPGAQFRRGVSSAFDDETTVKSATDSILVYIYHIIISFWNPIYARFHLCVIKTTAG